MKLTTLTDDEAQELLRTVRALNERSERSFKDFKMDEIPKSKKGNLPSVLEWADEERRKHIDSILDWWDDYTKERTARGKRSRYLTPLVIMFVGPIVGGVLVAVIIKAFGV